MPDDWALAAARKALAAGAGPAAGQTTEDWALAAARRALASAEATGGADGPPAKRPRVDDGADADDEGGGDDSESDSGGMEEAPMPAAPAPPPRVGGDPWWRCACGFHNRSINDVCGGVGNLGCKRPRPAAPTGTVSLSEEMADIVRAEGAGGALSADANPVDNRDRELSEEEKHEIMELTCDTRDGVTMRVEIARGNIRLTAAGERAWRSSGKGTTTPVKWCPADKERGSCGAGSGCMHGHIAPKSRGNLDAMFGSLHPAGYDRCAPVRGATRGSLLHGQAELAAALRKPDETVAVKVHKIDAATLKMKAGFVLLRATLTVGRLTGACCVVPKTLLYLTDEARQFMGYHNSITWCHDDRENQEGCTRGDGCKFAHVLACDKARIVQALRLPQAVARDPPVVPEDSDEEVVDTAGRTIGTAMMQQRMMGGSMPDQPDAPAAEVERTREVRLKADVNGRLNAGAVLCQAGDLQMSRKVRTVFAMRGWVSWCAEDKAGMQCRAGERGGCGFAHVNPDVKTQVKLLFQDPRARTPNPPRLHGTTGFFGW